MAETRDRAGYSDPPIVRHLANRNTGKMKDVYV